MTDVAEKPSHHLGNWSGTFEISLSGTNYEEFHLENFTGINSNISSTRL